MTEEFLDFLVENLLYDGNGGELGYFKDGRCGCNDWEFSKIIKEDFKQRIQELEFQFNL